MSRRGVRTALSLLLVVVIFVGVLPQVADLGEVTAAIGQMTWVEVGSLAAAGGWNLVTYWLLFLAALPGLGLGQAVVVTQSSTAVANTAPAGAALGMGLTYAMLASWGFPRPVVTLTVLVTGVWNNFAKLGMPVLALSLLALQGQTTLAEAVLAAAGLGGLAVAVTAFGLVLRGDRPARWVGDQAGRLAGPLLAAAHRSRPQGWGDSVVGFRQHTIGLLRRRWLTLTVASLVSHLSLYLVLLLALRHVGVSDDEVGWAAVLAAFAFVRLVSALPLTPGGVGIVELGLTGALVAAGGDEARVLAAVLVFRALTYLLPIPIGALTYLGWRRQVGRAARVRTPDRTPSAMSPAGPA